MNNLQGEQTTQLEKGQIIKGHQGTYQIIQTIGSGSISAVYQATRLEDKQTIAIKKVDSQTVRVQFDYMNFYQLKDDRKNVYYESEIEISKKIQEINSQNLIKIYEIILVNSDSSLIVTEFCDGCDLQTFSLTFFINWHIAIEFGYQIANGINDLHIHNITHRDLKPENIFVSSVKSQSSSKQSDYFLKIGDFGLSISGDMYKSNVGTPNYMCPEQLKSGDKSKETDIFAFGLIFYEIIEKIEYFPGKNSNEIFKQIKEFQAYDKSKLSKIDNEDILKKINSIIDRCLQLEPKNRISSQELVKELKQILNDLQSIPENQCEISLRVPQEQYLTQQNKFQNIYFLNPNLNTASNQQRQINLNKVIKKVDSEIVEDSPDNGNVSRDNKSIKNNSDLMNESKKDMNLSKFSEEKRNQQKQGEKQIKDFI